MLRETSRQFSVIALAQMTASGRFRRYCRRKTVEKIKQDVAVNQRVQLREPSPAGCLFHSFRSFATCLETLPRVFDAPKNARRSLVPEPRRNLSTVPPCSVLPALSEPAPASPSCRSTSRSRRAYRPEGWGFPSRRPSLGSSLLAPRLSPDS